MLADFLWFGFSSFYNLHQQNSDEGASRHIYGREVQMSQYLDGHRVLKKKVAMAKILAQTFLRHRLAAKLARVLRKNLSISPSRHYLHTPHSRSLAPFPLLKQNLSRLT
jgi:hypothetical protein